MPNPGSTGRAGKRLLSPVGVCGGGPGRRDSHLAAWVANPSFSASDSPDGRSPWLEVKSCHVDA